MNEQKAFRSLGCPEQVVSNAPLSMLIDLVGQRLTMAKDVAAIKYVHGLPVEDPRRELTILYSIADALSDVWLYHVIGKRFFRDQIMANKVVQYAFQERWPAHPSEVPSVEDDLALYARPALDSITARMMRQFTHLREAPRLTLSCIEHLVDDRLDARQWETPLAEVYRQAALLALGSFCTDT